jgi:hypothetical protein
MSAMPERYTFENFNATNMAVGHKAKIVKAGAQNVELASLAADLESLKQALVQEASSAADYQTVAEVQAAKEAADAGDEAGVERHLAKAGRWALDVAVRIGSAMAAGALNHALGI